MRFEVEGLSDLLTTLGSMDSRVLHAAKEALVIEGETVMTRAKRLTPVDTGALRSSGRVQAPVLESPTRASVTLGFGGPAKVYAIYVHEDLNARHRVGQAKFLEQPVREAASRFARNVSAHVSSRLKRGM